MRFMKYFPTTHALIVCIGIFLVTSLGFISHVSADSVNIRLDVAVCNANLFCEEIIGENYGSCPSDCEAPPTPPATTTDSGGTPPSGGGATAKYADDTPSDFSLVFPATPSIASGSVQQRIPTKSPTKNAPQVPAPGIVGLLSISPSIDRATLNFKTSLPTILNISWGETATYEQGSSADSWYYQKHTKDITGLKPGTRYYYRLELRDTLGRIVNYEGFFITTASDAVAKLPVVNDFLMRPGNSPGEVLLSWNVRDALESVALEDERRINNAASVSGTDEVIQKKKLFVRLTRSEFGYSTDPREGKVIYEGSGQQATDTGLEEGKTYYYSIFVMDQNGEHSAPAIIVLVNQPDSSGLGEAKKDSKIIFDPLIRDGKPLYMSLNKKTGDFVGFCAFGDENATENGLSMRFLQNNTELSVHSGIIKVINEGDVKIHVENPLLGDQDLIGICLDSYESQVSTFYILPKNPDGSFELIFPYPNGNFSGKSSYDFTIGMLKYSGEKIVLKKGEIRFIMKSKSEGFPWIKTICAIAFILAVSRLLIRKKKGH
jgi:hypothetical protein